MKPKYKRERRFKFWFNSLESLSLSNALFFISTEMNIQTVIGRPQIVCFSSVQILKLKLKESVH